MQKISGFLRKLAIQPGSPLKYALCLQDAEAIPLNGLLNQTLSFHFSGPIQCIYCQRSIKKSFNQGYCYVCFRKLARCDHCIVKPELCHYHLGTCREPRWGKAVCMQKHIVYLSYTSGIKVGITRRTNMPARWFDQGATIAMPIYEVATRLQSGLLETLIKAHLNDKTNWRAMLKNDEYDVDLHAFWQAHYPNQAHDIQALFSDNPHFQGTTPQILADHGCSQTFIYPRLEHALTVQSINVEKTPTFSGKLIGMKGQYLLFDCGVINIRKYTGYQVEIGLPTVSDTDDNPSR